MATKKQKHQEALMRRERFLAELKRTGLEAQQKDVAQRRRKELEAWEEQHEKKHSWQKRIKECPHCRIEMHAAKQAQMQQAAS